jgi:acyl carrier protein
MISAFDGDALVVDTFLLSCRVLGRGVEHQLLAHLGTRAAAAGATQVRVPYVRTERNSPALRFLESLDATVSTDGDTIWFTFDPATLSELTYRPQTLTAASDEVALNVMSSGSAVDSVAIERVASELADMALVATLARERPRRPRPAIEQSYIAPRNQLESDLTELWAAILGLESVGVADSFFDLGGSSLLAVDMIAQLEAQLGHNLSIVDMYDGPTIQAIARILEGDDTSAERVGRSRDRGASRRAARSARPSRRRGRS